MVKDNKDIQQKEKVVRKSVRIANSNTVDKVNTTTTKKVKTETKADKYKKLINKFGLDETYTKVNVKPKFDNVKSNIPPLQDYNFEADLLMLPETKEGYKYLFVICDLWSDELDSTPLKTKEPTEVLEAMKKIFKSGKYLKKPKASIGTDAGTEFKGVFHKWLYDNSIYHSVSLPHRHKQRGNIENCNKLIGRFLINYMNMKEEQTGKEYKEWTDILPELMKELNAIRKRPDLDPFKYNYPISKDETDQKYHVGDLVIRKLDVPKNALNNEETGKFRTGDYRYDVKEPRKIKYVLYYPKNIRYVLEGYPNVSYTQDEILPAPKNETENKYAVRKILDKKVMKRKVHYLVWWKKYKKAESTWEPIDRLIEDGLKDEIDEYEAHIKDKAESKKK
jgi:hypothetical protein